MDCIRVSRAAARDVERDGVTELRGVPPSALQFNQWTIPLILERRHKSVSFTSHASSLLISTGRAFGCGRVGRRTVSAAAPRLV